MPEQSGIMLGVGGDLVQTRGQGRMTRNRMLAVLAVAVILAGVRGRRHVRERTRHHHVDPCCLSASQGADNRTGSTHHHSE